MFVAPEAATEDEPMSRYLIATMVLALSLMLAATTAQAATAETVSVITDTTWRATNPQPPTGWNTDLNFDDSNAAGWENAVGSTSNNHIWYKSLHSADAPNNAWFRHIFTLDDAATAASGTFHFDDNGQAYINGQLIVDDTGGGASNFNLTLDPTLFVVGQNLIAIHGIDTIAPDNSVGVNMTITTVPEPAAAGMLGVAAMLLSRSHRRRVSPSTKTPTAL